MKVKLLIPMKIDGKDWNAGDEVNISEDKAIGWKNRGWIESKAKKEVKIKKETKELKIDSKETKDEANQD